MRATIARIRNHVVTGFIFIMPVLIAIAVVSRFWRQLLRVGGILSNLLRVDTFLGPSGDAVMAVVFFLFICAAAGFLVRLSFLKRLSDRIDQRLDSFIPGYSQLRSETKRKIGAGEEQAPPRFEGCLVQVQEMWEPGYVIEENADGTETVFVPQAPAALYGQVYVVHPGQIRKLGIDSAEVNAHLRRFGKGIMAPHAAPPA